MTTPKYKAEQVVSFSAISRESFLELLTAEAVGKIDAKIEQEMLSGQYSIGTFVQGIPIEICHRVSKIYEAHGYKVEISERKSTIPYCRTMKFWWIPPKSKENVDIVQGAGNMAS